jgi:regulatory protein spx
MIKVIKLYTFFSCTSCRKAKKALMENGIPFKEQNMSSDPLSKEEVLELLSFTKNGTTDLMSTRSQEVKDLDPNVLEDLSLNEWIEFVHKHPGVLRRPLLLTTNRLIVGYNKEEYDRLIKKATPSNHRSAKIMG